MNAIYQIIYKSIAKNDFSDEELLQMLKHFRANNQRIGVTGMLIYDGLAFVQVLEGDEDIVKLLYTLIQNDPRHSNVKTLISDKIDFRQFPGWTMGFSKISNANIEGYEEVNDFFYSKKCLADVEYGVAKMLLQIYGSGCI